MFSIIGIVVVFGCIVAGYLMEHGNLTVLLQPAELLIVAGAALGTLLISNPVHTLKQMMSGVIGAFRSSKYDQQRYIDLLTMMYELLQKARKEGLVSLESDIEEPDKSPLFLKYEDFMKQHHAVAFVCDTMRMAVSGGVEVFDLDQMLEADMEVHHHEAGEPVSAMSTVADSLPGLGIVAAVLGVVITMSALGGPPEEIGRKVAAALVGTFLGVLLCYGLVGPLAARMGKMADEEHAFMMVLRVTMIAFLKGVAPIMAVEIGRRTVPGHVRPSFTAIEEACRGARTEAAAAAAADGAADATAAGAG
ncbi:MAG: flagellar motor stator protein MotA [Terriglobales bacterium]